MDEFEAFWVNLSALEQNASLRSTDEMWHAAPIQSSFLEVNSFSVHKVYEEEKLYLPWVFEAKSTQHYSHVCEWSTKFHTVKAAHKEVSHSTSVHQHLKT